jgi:hypothetical protein
MTRTMIPTEPAAAPLRGNARTEAALKRLRTAMADIEAEIVANRGIYPFNYGRVTQSELCRRADVKKATLQNPVHKDSTRVEIIAWLDELNARLTHTRDSTRERVTAVADDLATEVERLTLVNKDLQMRLRTAEMLIEQLRQKNAHLKH